MAHYLLSKCLSICGLTSNTMMNPGTLESMQKQWKRDMSPPSHQVVFQGCQGALLGIWLPQSFTTSVIFTFTHYIVSMSYCRKFRLFVIYMSKLVSPCEDLNPVSKMAFNKLNMDFCWEYTVQKNRTTFPDVPLLPEISRWNDPKSRVPFTFQLDFPENFGK